MNDDRRAEVLCVVVATDSAEVGGLARIADDLEISPHVARVSGNGELAVITGPRARAVDVRPCCHGSTVVAVTVDRTA